METTIRAFFAIDFPEITKKEINHSIILPLQKNLHGHHIHWTAPSNLHVTLQFLEKIKYEHLERLIELAKAELKNENAFYLELGEIEYFPSLNNPKIISMKTEPHDTLTSLSQKLGKCIADLEYSPENRIFRGHLTLGKIRDKNIADAEINQLILPKLKKIGVHEIVLFHSEKTPAGSHYTPIARVPLDSNINLRVKL
jgi:2'-5' RNA ligase